MQKNDLQIMARWLLVSDSSDKEMSESQEEHFQPACATWVLRTTQSSQTTF